MKYVFAGAFILCGLLYFAGCEAQQMTSREIENMARRELPVGSTKSLIEGFFHRHRLQFTYDEFTNRYISNIRYTSLDKYANEGVLIEFYLDKQKKLERIKVQNYSTAP